jgi:hypothetical protein
LFSNQNTLQVTTDSNTFQITKVHEVLNKNGSEETLDLINKYWE